MTIEYVTKAFKTKLKADKKRFPRQFESLMKIACTCVDVHNWYVEYSLKEMKGEGLTVYSPKEDLMRYSPREVRKKLTVLTKTSPQFAKFTSVPSVPRCMEFEHIHKTYKGGKGVKYVFTRQCEYAAKKIDENVQNFLDKCKSENIEPTEEQVEKERVFIGRRGKRAKKDDFYNVKGFPKFVSKQRHISFTIDNVALDYENKCVTLPPSNGSKKFNIEGFKGEKIFFHDHGIIPNDIDKSSLYTFSYDGEDWWMSVTQNVPIATISQETERFVLGLDIGVKNPAYLSTGQFLSSITKDGHYRELLRQSKSYQKGLSHNRLKSTREKKECKYGEKKKKPWSRTYRYTKGRKAAVDNTLLRYKDYIFKNFVSSIPWNRVKGVVIEGNVSPEAWKRHKKWAPKLQQECVGRVRDMIVSKAEELKIPVMKAPVNYASSQICSCCGSRKRIELSERVYKCPVCGEEINRDLNAAINLANLWDSGVLVSYKEKKENDSSEDDKKC